MHNIKIIEGCKNFHFIGIGGISMSGLAEILHKAGYGVTGSDQKDSENISRLRKASIDVKIGHDEKNIDDGAKDTVVVYNSAVPMNNPEILKAKKLNFHLMDRAELLGRLMGNYKKSICIAGTHGKTTTTSMLAEIFIFAGRNPTVLNGGIVNSMGGALRIGSRDVVIAEACEYHNSFLKFYPNVGIILNLEMDHSDFFKDIDHLRKSFVGFSKNIHKDGLLVINAAIPNLQQFKEGSGCRMATFGNNGRLSAKNISYNNLGHGQFDVFENDICIGSISLAVPGEHNIQNALAATSCALEFGIGFDDIKGALAAFKGALRRFTRMGSFNGAVVVDDYAHHPMEVGATIAAARNMEIGRLWAVFQPHTHTRTKLYLSEFAKALAAADHSIVLDIYNPVGREEESCPVHSEDLVAAASAYTSNCLYMPDFDAAAAYLKEHVLPGDMVITMGAGNVDALAVMLVE